MYPLGGAQNLNFFFFVHLNLSSIFVTKPHFTCTTFPHVSLGENMAYEHVHNNPAVMYCALVGGEVYCGIPGFPLYSHHDSAAAQTHPY